MTYPDGQVYDCVDLLELRDGKVFRETVYWAPPFDAPDWRRPFVERARIGRSWASTGEAVEIGGRPTTVNDIVRIARGAPAVLADEAVAQDGSVAGRSSTS